MGVTVWKPGDRVGVGWHGGHCFTCESCRRGDFITCRNALISGITQDGGYAEYMVARQEAVARLPDGLTDTEAAPLLCAGITTFNALRNSPARAGELVAVQGLGGLGHLAVQFAAKLGFRTVAIARGGDKRALAEQLGAATYIDSAAEDAAQALSRMGGARVILASAPSSSAIESILDGLGVGGQLLLVAAPAEPIRISPLAFIGARSILPGVAERAREGLRGDACVQRTQRCATDDRDVSARSRQRGVRTHGERPRPVPGGADDVVALRRC